MILCMDWGHYVVLRSTNSVFYIIGILVSTYSVPNTHNLPNKYLTATVSCNSRAWLPNPYLIIPNPSDYVRNRGIRHVLGVFFDWQKVFSKVVLS